MSLALVGQRKGARPGRASHESLSALQAVRLESAWAERVRYMVVVDSSGRQDTEESILLGVDFSSKER